MSVSRPLSLQLPRVFILSWIILLWVVAESPGKGQDSAKTYADLSHYSKVFGHEKNYRIYLPQEYIKDIRRYPVIYFFHGWGGRHYKDDNALLEYDRIGDLVDKYQVILVMWDGNIEEIDPRPYNIGNHKDIRYRVQMKDYFPELVTYIDSAYRTLSDRNHRGIIGFSMGGIMSFFLAGKYPHKVCAAVNLAGTPEFFIGYPENHTLYPVRYAFKNLMEVETRQHSGDSDILVYLNEEVRKGAEWEGNPYEFYGFTGGHMVDKPGETTAFEMAIKFVAGNFSDRKFFPVRWSHYDIYPDFDVWDYTVRSNKNRPGFLYLSDVSKEGFGVYTNKWLPDGPTLDSIECEIISAPVYIPGKTYNTVTWSAVTSGVAEGETIADANGRIAIKTDGRGNEIGLYDTTGQPDFIVTKYWLNDSARLLTTGESNQLYIEILNRGAELIGRQNLKVSLQTADTSITISASVIHVSASAKQRLIQLRPFNILCTKLPPSHGEPYQVRMKVNIEWADTFCRDEILIPVLFEAACFNDVRIDEGKEIKERIFGSGNGDGIANAGEHILIYNGEHRLRLFTNDKWVDHSFEELVDQQIPAIWEDGYTLSSLLKISDDCPDGHIIEFTGYYETNTWNPIERNLHWGKVFIIVRNFNHHKNEND
jgi:enterochelin esterase-like enzyme